VCAESHALWPWLITAAVVDGGQERRWGSAAERMAIISDRPGRISCQTAEAVSPQSYGLRPPSPAPRRANE